MRLITRRPATARERVSRMDGLAVMIAPQRSRWRPC